MGIDMGIDMGIGMDMDIDKLVVDFDNNYCRNTVFHLTIVEQI